MAQKINPISFRLGTTQVWNFTLQFYGKSYSSYFLLIHKYLEVKRHLCEYLSLNFVLLEFQRWEFFKDKILLSVYYSHLKDVTVQTLFKKASKIINQWFPLYVIICPHLKLQKTSTTILLSHYVSHLMEKNISPKKITWNLCELLESEMNSNKISYFKFGVLDLRLKGFKIQISGRFNNSKTPMSKKIECKIGTLPLTRIKSSIEYLNTNIHSKLGICGLQIWLFYEIQN